MIFIFYLVLKRLMITKNSVMKIQNFDVNHESRLVKSNPDNRRTYLLLVVFLYDVNMTISADWESLCVLTWCILQQVKATSFSCGYRVCFWCVPGSCKGLLLMMIGAATISLSTAGNQLCDSQRGVIRIALADSFSILVNTCQLRLKGGKQKSKYFSHVTENVSVAMESASDFWEI